MKPINKNGTVKEIRALRKYRTELYKNKPHKYFEVLKSNREKASQSSDIFFVL